MKLSIVLPAAAAAGVAGAAALAGLTLTASASAGRPAPAVPAPAVPASGGPGIAVYDCADKPVVRPAEFGIFCDGSDNLVRLHWTSWNATEATGTGVDYVDNCLPNCATGKWRHQDVIVVLWRGQPVTHQPGQYGYSTMTLLFPGSGRTQALTPPGAYN